MDPKQYSIDWYKEWKNICPESGRFTDDEGYELVEDAMKDWTEKKIASETLYKRLFEEVKITGA